MVWPAALSVCATVFLSGMWSRSRGLGLETVSRTNNVSSQSRLGLGPIRLGPRLGLGPKLLPVPVLTANLDLSHPVSFYKPFPSLRRAPIDDRSTSRTDWRETAAMAVSFMSRGKGRLFTPFPAVSQLHPVL